MKSHDHQHINTDRFADSAGVPWQGRSFSENPFANDDGKARPELISAIEEFHNLASGANTSQVFVEFSNSRLLIPLLADLGESGEGAHGQTVDKSADLSIVTVETPDGQTGLPVFSSVETMLRWNPVARPVPSDAIRVALAAASEGTTRIVLDPGSPTEFAFRRNAIAAMAQQKFWVHPTYDEAVLEAISAGVADNEPIEAIGVGTADPQSRLAGPEVKVELQVRRGLSKEDLELVLNRITANWAANEVIASSVDSMTIVVKPVD